MTLKGIKENEREIDVRTISIQIYAVLMGAEPPDTHNWKATLFGNPIITNTSKILKKKYLMAFRILACYTRLIIILGKKQTIYLKKKKW